MDVFTAEFKDIEGRLDCYYYKPEFTDLEKTVAQKTDKVLGDFVIDIAGGATPKIEDSEKYYTDDPNVGVVFLRVQNISPEGLKLNDCKFITRHTHNNSLKRSQVNEFDLITKITGVGRMAVSAVAPSGFTGNINQHLVVIKTRNYETSKVLAAFLNTDIGEKLAKRRSTGGTRPALDYQALKSIPIIYKPEIAQIMEDAHAKRNQNIEEAKRLIPAIDQLILNELGVLRPPKNDTKSFVIDASLIEGRIDPYYYQPIFTEFNDSLQNSKYNIKPLSRFIKAITNGFDYRRFTDSGTPYLKVSNIKPFDIDRSDIDYVGVRSDEINKPIQLKRGNILLTRKGTFGVALAIDEDYDDIICSEIFNIEPLNEINPEYLAAVLNSSIGQVQFDRVKIGAIMGSLSQEAVKSISIPAPPLSKQGEITEEVRKILRDSERLRQDAESIIIEAQREVEQILFK